MAGFVLAALLGFQTARFANPIDFDFEVGATEFAVESLGKTTGIPMRVVGPASKETVFLHVENRPIREVMDELAKAIVAEWSLSSDGYWTLQRTAKQESDAYAARFAKDVEQAEQWKKNVLKHLDQPFDSKSLDKMVKEYRQLDYDLEMAQRKDENINKRDAERLGTLQEQGPGKRLFARCIKDLDVRQIAKAMREGHMVFSTDPNASQLPFPTDIRPALKLAYDEQLTWGDMLVRNPARPLPPKEDDYDSTEPPEAERDPWDRARMQSWERLLPYRQVPTHAILKVSDGYWSVTAWSDDGVPILESFEESFATYDRLEDEYKFLLSFDEDATKPLEVKPSSEWQALYELTRIDRKNQEEPEFKTPLSKAEARRILQPYFVDPVHNDPLKIGNQEILLELVKKERRSVIACLPDSMLQTRIQNRPVSRLLSNTQDDLSNYDDIQTTISDQWVSITPSFPLSDWNQKMDRNAARMFGQEYRSTGNVSLATYLKASIGRKVENAEIQPPYFLNLQFSKNVAWSIPQRANFRYLLLSLNDDQLLRLKQGQVIRYSQLTPEQFDLIQPLILGSHVRMYVYNEPTTNFAAIDPTMEMPRGVVNSGGIALEMAEDEFCGVHKEGELGEDDLTLLRLDQRKEFYVSREFRCFAGGFIDIPQTSFLDFRKQNRLTLKCYTAPDRYVSDDFVEAMPEGGKRYPYSELSPKMIERINQAKNFLW